MAVRTKSLSARQVYAISRALADPTRYQILRRIAEQNATTCTACSELREAFPIAPATLSHHLRELEAASLVETSKRGKYVDVRFCRELWSAYLAALGEL